MTDGFILLGFLAIIFAVAVIRGRRRLGVGSTSRVFALAAFGFAIAVLVLWATQRKCLGGPGRPRPQPAWPWLSQHSLPHGPITFPPSAA